MRPIPRTAEALSSHENVVLNLERRTMFSSELEQISGLGGRLTVIGRKEIGRPEIRPPHLRFTSGMSVRCRGMHLLLLFDLGFRFCCGPTVVHAVVSLLQPCFLLHECRRMLSNFLSYLRVFRKELFQWFVALQVITVVDK